jgi:hypothetical protein
MEAPIEKEKRGGQNRMKLEFTTKRNGACLEFHPPIEG